MSTRLSTAGLVIAVSLLGSGCAHVQLKRNTVNQAQTVSDIYQQQVLNNLAMFVYDANSLPHFAYADGGASSITDNANSGVPNFNTRGPISFGLNVSRGIDERWTLTPINDPNKLTLMRCAYQHAVQGATLNPAVNVKCSGGIACPDCKSRFTTFYGEGKAPSCLKNCWFGFGTKAEVPKHCPCSYVGNYCGVYVWVETGQGRDQLAQLTMMMLDYALFDPVEERELPTKQVVDVLKLKVDKNGNPVDGTGKIIPLNVDGTPKEGKFVYVKEKTTETYNKKIEDTIAKMKKPPTYYPRTRTIRPGSGLLPDELRRRTLAR